LRYQNLQEFEQKLTETLVTRSFVGFWGKKEFLPSLITANPCDPLTIPRMRIVKEHNC
jgi:hypothetical protein